MLLEDTIEPMNQNTPVAPLEDWHGGGRTGWLAGTFCKLPGANMMPILFGDSSTLELGKACI